MLFVGAERERERERERGRDEERERERVRALGVDVVTNVRRARYSIVNQTLALLGCFIACCLSNGCQRPDPRANRVASTVPEPAPAQPQEPPMLVGDWLQPLEDEGRGVGVVAIPLGARTKRPLVVAVHGAGSLPEWMCSAARAGLGSHPFVVCPHSLPNAGALASWASPEQLATAVERAVRAAVARFPEYVDTTEAMYFGHSQGAMIAPLALGRTGVHFRYALFFEGLPPDAPAAKAQLLRAHLERFLLVSGQGGWSQGHEQLANSFRGTPMAAKHVHGKFGHFFNEEVFVAMRRELPWLVDGATAWLSEQSAPPTVTNASAVR